MATKRELHRRWKRDMEFNLSDDSKGVPNQEELTGFSGPVVGTIKLDAETQTLEIIPNSNLPTENKEPDAK